MAVVSRDGHRVELATLALARDIIKKGPSPDD